LRCWRRADCRGTEVLDEVAALGMRQRAEAGDDLVRRHAGRL
jgi:hypothetical protein